MIVYLLLVPLFLLLLIAVQAVYTRKTAIRLPEAKGARLHKHQGGKSLLHIGESTVAGVGVTDIGQGLTANIVKGLQDSGHHWSWQILGSNGARIAEAEGWCAESGSGESDCGENG
jgi:hypothetical protein